MPNVAKSLREKIKESMSSDERYAVILNEVKDKQLAKEINKLFEAKMILKNQEKADERFINKITDSQWKKDRAKYAQDAKSRKEALIYNEDGTIKDNFKALLNKTTADIEDEASAMFEKKFGVELSDKAVEELVKLKNTSNELKDIAMKSPNGSAERLAYGQSLVRLQDFMKGVTEPTEKMNLGQIASSVKDDVISRFSKEKGIGNVGEVAKLAAQVITTPVYKSIQAALDFSGMFRQGFKTLATGLSQGRADIWADNVGRGFKPILNIGNKEKMQEVADVFKATMFGDEHYEEMLKAGLRIGEVEDFFPTSIAEKLPVLGNAFKASDESFTILVQGMRFDMYKKLRQNLIATYGEVTEKQLKDIAEVANSMTGSGSLGKLESASGLINKLFFSGRFIRSQLDTFTMPFDPTLDPVARNAATRASLSTLSMIGTLMLAAGTIGEVETDWRSSKFGKMKVPGSKDTWIDLTAGLGGYISLAAKQWTGQSKSSVTGKITELGEKYGSPTRFDVLMNWITGKAAPGPSQAIQVLRGKTYSGEKPTPTGVATNLVTPIGAGNFIDVLQNEDMSIALMALIADSVGASASSYEKFK